MDPATAQQQNTTETQNYTAPQSGQDDLSGKKPFGQFWLDRNKKLIALGIIIVVVILAAFFVLLPKGSYSFSINGQTVPRDDFEQIYTYYKDQLAAQNFNRNDVLTSTQQFFVEHYILTQYYISHGHSESELKNNAQRLPPVTGIPPVLDQMNRENNVAKQSVLATLGIQSVSGKVFKLSASSELGSADRASLSDLLTSRIVLYKNEIDQGLSMTQVQQDFAQDSALIALPQISRDIIQLTNMTKSHPVIPDPTFVNDTFATKPLTTSDIINLSTDHSLWYGFVYVESNTNGKYTGYNEWLADKAKSVKITSNFSGVN